MFLREDPVKFSRIYFSSLSAVRTTWYSVQTHIRQQHPSGRPDVMVNRPDALQSSRKSQCFSASVRTTWLYRPDVVQCLTSIKVSDSRHNYGKTAATVRAMCDLVRTMFFIRQDVYQFNRRDVSLNGPDAISLIMEILCSRSATVRMLGQHSPDAAFLWKLSVLLWKSDCS
jgi:hypothetical protein